MKLFGACLCGAVLLSLAATAPSTESAAAKAPRFLVTITGTQHVEWTLEQVSPRPCTFKGHGEQSETFRTSRPVKVITPTAGPSGTREFQALVRGAWRRVVPLIGAEHRAYSVVEAPSPDCRGIPTEFRTSCSGTNPLVAGAGVALMRVRRQIALHVPVDTPWIQRRPATCDIRLFDLRNFYEAAVFGTHVYRPVIGGTFENRRAKTLRSRIDVRYCIDPSESSNVDLVLKTSCGPGRGSGLVLSGQLEAAWTITFRRTR
ncbi:MAG TPA: hypothetical protein VIZ29_00185 [Gaiellaceae bacterium]